MSYSKTNEIKALESTIKIPSPSCPSFEEMFPYPQNSSKSETTLGVLVKESKDSESKDSKSELELGWVIVK